MSSAMACDPPPMARLDRPLDIPKRMAVMMEMEMEWSLGFWR